jgi:methionine-rich copper-binding protein CopC
MALLLAAGVAACDKVPLLAPQNSTINLSSNTLVVPTNGTAGLTAFVTEPSGTPVQNGTTVRFTTTLGTVTPAETQTTNGVAVAMFQAGTSSGIAEVHAISGGATGTAPATPTNVVKITVGAAAVGTLTLQASPASIGPSGGTVQITASLVDANGGSLAGIPVAFSSDQGTLSPATATTNASGQAVTTLTSAQTTIVTATAGTKSGTVTVTLRAGPGIAVTCAPAVGAGTNCSAVAASSSNNTATVVFTVSKGTGTSNLRDTTIDFGDGTTQGLGTLAGGAATVSHTYTGPSGSSPVAYTATVRANDVNGETTSASVSVNVTPRAPLTVSLTATGPPARTVNFTATVTGGDAQSFAWDFETDGQTDATTSVNTTSHFYTAAKNYTATVTVTTTDGRTATGRVEFNITP